MWQKPVQASVTLLYKTGPVKDEGLTTLPGGEVFISMCVVTGEPTMLQWNSSTSKFTLMALVKPTRLETKSRGQ